jgi:hypothetical protein
MSPAPWSFSCTAPEAVGALTKTARLPGRCRTRHRAIPRKDSQAVRSLGGHRVVSCPKSRHVGAVQSRAMLGERASKRLTAWSFPTREDSGVSKRARHRVPLRRKSARLMKSDCDARHGIPRGAMIDYKARFALENPLIETGERGANSPLLRRLCRDQLWRNESISVMGICRCSGRADRACPNLRHLICRCAGPRPRDGRRGTKTVGHQMVGSNSVRRKQKSKPWADHIFVVVNSRPALANSIGPIAVLRITRVQPAA